MLQFKKLLKKSGHVLRPLTLKRRAQEVAPGKYFLPLERDKYRENQFLFFCWKETNIGRNSPSASAGFC